MSRTSASAGNGTLVGSLISNPSLLLLATGTLTGLKFPLGKLAGEAGISPVLWSTLPSLGVAVFLLPALIIHGSFAFPGRKLVRFAVIAGLVSFILPNVVLYVVIPRLGAGYMGLMFALSPVFTLTFSALAGLQTPKRLGLAGIGVGLLGAAVVSLTRSAAADAPEPIWIAAGFVVPAGLAFGNVYRSLAWPEDVSPDLIGFWSHAIALLGFFLLSLLVEGTVPLLSLAAIPVPALVQALAAAAAVPLFFRLQRLGGPILLSQLGYVAAAVGLVAATLLLGERYGWMTWAGAAIVALGIALTVVSRVRS